jgi:CheY-like chemotaxis protein
MGIFSAAIALFSNRGVDHQKELPERPSADEVEPESTILVIDDDPTLLQSVRSLLVKRGFNVLTSSSLPRGLGVLRNAIGDIRIVLLNYSMPKLNGDESLKFVRQLRPNAKVIGLTAMNLNSESREYPDGVDRLLTKPVVATTLLGAVDELLGNGRTATSAIQPSTQRRRSGDLAVGEAQLATKGNAISSSMTDDTVSNQRRLPDPEICRTKHLEHSLGSSVCLVKNHQDCKYARRFYSSIFCYHPDHRSFEKTDRP